MLTLFGDRQRFCDGISRRNFLKIGAFGAGLSLADLLRGRANAGTTPSPKAAIMIQLPGGPSHLDTYDLKPGAPAEFRGEFRPIDTNILGIRICELMPRQAAMMDKLALVRTICPTREEHSDAETTTGYPEAVNVSQHHPSVGSVVSKVRGDGKGGVPAYITLRGMTPGCEPGFLGVAHRGFQPGGAGVENLRLAQGVDLGRFDDRRVLLKRFDNVRRDIDAKGTMDGLDAFANRAFDMVVSGAVRKALDLSREEPRTLDRYKGVEPFLTARRLIETGVGCVTLSYGSWDTHSSNFKSLRSQLPPLDRGISSLVQDLHDRGLENDVVTIVWGEFGRTPRINGNDGGRDHWNPVMSALIAGGGLKMGQAIGTTNERAEHPKDRAFTPSQVLATLYHALGIDAARTFLNGSGRPMYVLDDREPIKELI